MKLSVLIPLYNESSYLVRCLDNVFEVNIPNWKIEVIAINDGSADGSLGILKQYKKQKPGLRIITYKNNHGKGYALKKGIKHAFGDVLIVQDADLEYDPNDYHAILKEYGNHKTLVVYGSRILGAGVYTNYNASPIYLIGGLLLTRIVNLFFNSKITDQPTCYKSWRSSLSRGLVDTSRSNGFDFEVEMTAYFSRQTKIKEVPIHYYPRTVSHGKKIRLSDFFLSVWRVFKQIGYKK